MVVGVILLGLIGWGSHGNYQAAERHVFTWISKVTPELASWAKNLSFTDVVVLDNSVDSYLNLENEGITYWYLATSYELDPLNLDVLEQQLVTLANASPNGHVYLDDSNRLLEVRGVIAINNLFDAVREVQASNNRKFILNGYVDSFAHSVYPEMNMMEIDFDAYQPMTIQYDGVIQLLEIAAPATIGIYVWAYGVGNGLSWSTMTEGCLESPYRQAKENELTRLVIWNGYVGMDELLQSLDPVGMYMACLYYYPDWWDKVRTENMEFIEGN